MFARFPMAAEEMPPNKLPLDPMLPDRLELEKLLEGLLNDMVRIRGAFERACETRSVVLPAAGNVRGVWEQLYIDSALSGVFSSLQ